MQQKFPSPCGEEVLKAEQPPSPDEVTKMFPSPCGEEVLKVDFYMNVQNNYITHTGRFSSPCGEEILKAATQSPNDLIEIIKFPSPCGKEILKVWQWWRSRTSENSFRPLAGKRF